MFDSLFFDVNCANMQTKTMRLGLALLLHIFFVISVSGNAAPCTSQRFHLTTHAVIDSTGGEATSAGFGNNTCGRGRVPLYPALTVAQARQVCCEKGYAGFNMRIHDGEATGSGCFHFDLYGKARASSGYDAYVDTDWHPAPPPPPLPPTNRTTPPWQYNMSRFPAGWFGANQSGFENPKQLELMGKFSIVMFGWQHMQLPSNYTNLLELQIEQARQVKEAHPHIPTFVYLPIVDAQVTSIRTLCCPPISGLTYGFTHMCLAAVLRERSGPFQLDRRSVIRSRPLYWHAVSGTVSPAL